MLPVLYIIAGLPLDAEPIIPPTYADVDVDLSVLFVIFPVLYEYVTEELEDEPEIPPKYKV